MRLYLRKYSKYMLLTFSATNFRSFRGKQTLDLRASKEKPTYSWLDNNLAHVGKGEGVLKSKAIYGANASGKSNLIRALLAWQGVGLLSAQEKGVLSLIQPYSLDTSTSQLPSELVGTMEVDGKQYEYGFHATSEKISREWLVDCSKRRAVIFERTNQVLNTNSRFFPKDDRLDFLKQKQNEFFNEQVSFLSASALLEVNGTVKEVAEELRKIIVLSGVQSQHTDQMAGRLLLQEGMKESVLDFLQKMDLGIEDLIVFDRQDLTAIPLPEFKHFADRTSKRFFTVTSKKIKDDVSQSLAWLTDEGESDGTKKMIQLAPFVILTNLAGGILVVDEFESQLHTRLSREIVQLFNSTTGNPNNAQFIFSTHDTNLLDNKLLRRDQIALVEKNERGESEVYSLSEVKGVRNDANFEKDYLGGSYGAIPDVQELDIGLESATDGK